MDLLALDRAEQYVSGAYLVFVALLLVYLVIMAAKLQRIQRELREVADVAERPAAGGAPERARTETAVEGTPR